MATKKTDSFANVAALNLTESAANTQTSAKFNFPFSIMDKMALIIHRLEFDFTSPDQLNSSGDQILAGITAAATVSDMGNPTDPLIIEMMRIQRIDMGAAASGMLLHGPYVKDYSSLPGGGILVAPNPLYGMIKATGAAAVTTIHIRAYYTYIELATDEYWQLVESRRIITS